MRVCWTRSACVRGASHTEFIRGDDGEWYFLETSARVGGAYIVDVVEAATGVNLWREWAKAEIAGDGRFLRAAENRPPVSGHHPVARAAGASRYEAYDAPEVVRRIRKAHHAGLIVASPDGARISMLLEDYTERFYRDFHASAPPPARALD